MLKYLPAGFIGLMVGGLIAANSSTILTHLNWGASYLVHDFYRQFVRSDATERHYVVAARVVTLLLFVCSSATVYLLDTAKDAFDIILQIGAGTGLLYLVRWFWWRVNAWCEIVAMVTSFATSIVLLALVRNGTAISTHAALLITIAVTTVSWLMAAYLAPQTDAEVLTAFYRKVRPVGPGWSRIRAQAGLLEDEGASRENIPLALLGWVAGSMAIWSSLFAVGNFLYGRMGYAAALGAVFVICGLIVIRVLNTLWMDSARTAVARP
jgi:solute:Na+ symporter, SSS family